MKERKKIYQKWWFWVCIAFIVLIIKCTFYYFNNVVEITSSDLNKKVEIGKLTYYIKDDWETEENTKDNVVTQYYYPTSNTMIMVMFENNDNFGENSDIDSYFLDNYIAGMNLNDKDLIDKKIEKINNINCGVVRSYINGYDTIQYVIPNNDEIYVFCLGQKDNLNNENIEVIKNIIKKAEVTIETEKAQQIENEKENGEEIPENNSDNSSNTQINNKQETTNSNTSTTLTKNPQNTNSQNTNTQNANVQNTNTQSNKEAKKTTRNEKTNSATIQQNQEQQTPISSRYQSILNEYSQKLKNKTPSLITEYKNEASKNTNGLNGLATICNNKVSKLAEISNEGIQKMAEIYYKYGNGKYSEYEEWAGKLQDVYMSEASKIQDAYLDSAM